MSNNFPKPDKMSDKSQNRFFGNNQFATYHFSARKTETGSILKFTAVTKEWCLATLFFEFE